MHKIKLDKEFIAFVDDEDLEKVSNYTWCLRWANGRKAYVRARVPNSGQPGKCIMLHRFIVDAPKWCVVDHVDGNPLNNTRSNLRVCTQAENSRNSISVSGSSKYKGVSYVKRINKWRSYIKFNYKQIFLGYFKEEIDAAYAYNDAAKLYFKEFARLNET